MPTIQVLEKFARSFLHESNTLRRTSNNEIHRVHKIIERVFLKYTNERVAIQDLEKALVNLRYKMETSSLGEDEKTGMDFTMKKTAEGWKTFNRHYFIHAHSLKELNIATKALPKNTGYEKLGIQEALQEKLEIFFKAPNTPLS